MTPCWPRPTTTAHNCSPEGRFSHYITMAGAMGADSWTWRGEQFGKYEAAIGTGQAIFFFSTPFSGARTRGCLARFAGGARLKLAHGILAMLVTPFTDDYRLNEDALRREVPMGDYGGLHTASSPRRASVNFCTSMKPSARACSKS